MTNNPIYRVYKQKKTIDYRHEKNSNVYVRHEKTQTSLGICSV